MIRLSLIDCCLKTKCYTILAMETEASKNAPTGERAKADKEKGVSVDRRKEQVETGKDDDITADSQPSAVKQNQMRNMNKSEKYLKLCEVLLVAVVLLVIVGVLMLPTIFYVLMKAGGKSISQLQTGIAFSG